MLRTRPSGFRRRHLPQAAQVCKFCTRWKTRTLRFGVQYRASFDHCPARLTIACSDRFCSLSPTAVICTQQFEKINLVGVSLSGSCSAADMEARAARALGIEESNCTDRRCAVCTDPNVCEQCKRGSTLVKTPPSGVDKHPTYDDAGADAGWEVEDDVSSADCPKVCQACSTGCRACDDPSPAGCTACYPMYDLGSEGT